MKDGLNRVLLIGTVGQDCELKYAQSGTAVLSMRIATNENYVKDGERQERTEWHTVVLFGKRAEGLSRHIGKGTSLAIEGSLRTRSWEAKDGSKRYLTEVIASNVIFVGGGKSGWKREERQDDLEGDPIPF